MPLLRRNYFCSRANSVACGGRCGPPGGNQVTGQRLTGFQRTQMLDSTNAQGATPLHMAATAGHAKCAALLPAFGADPWQPDHKGYTSLHLAAGAGHTQCLLEILHDVQPNERRMSLSQLQVWQQACHSRHNATVVLIASAALRSSSAISVPARSALDLSLLCLACTLQ